MKTCAFYTLGCKVNQYETQGIRESLVKAGYREREAGMPCDIHVVNTCTVTAKTDKKSRRLIRSLKRRDPRAKIVVTGCYVELNEEEVRGIAPDILIVKNRDKDKIARIINSKRRLPGQSADNGKYQPLAISDFKDRAKAFLKAQDGCNNLCSYCKVPLVRGPSRSRDTESILAEAERLIARGFKEIILTGICLGVWGEDLFPKSSLDKLLGQLINLAGDFRIRLSSIEPKYVTTHLLSVMRGAPKICKHLHMPFQSGDDEVLKAMNRPYTSEEYVNIAKMVREHIPEASITTDIMVGFPGEAQASFNNTCRFIEKVRPSRIHIFSYSKRKGTRAALAQKEVAKETAKRRFEAIKALALKISYAYRRDFLQKETKVLVEARRDRDTGLLTGYDDKYIRFLLRGGDAHKCKIVSVIVKKIENGRTFGSIFENQHQRQGAS